MLSGQIKLGDHQIQRKIHSLWITEKRASNTNTSDDATPSNLVQVAWGKILRNQLSFLNSIEPWVPKLC